MPEISNNNEIILLLKNNGHKIANDIIGVKFGGCGISRVAAARTIMMSIKILFTLFLPCNWLH